MKNLDKEIIELIETKQQKKTSEAIHLINGIYRAQIISNLLSKGASYNQAEDCYYFGLFIFFEKTDQKVLSEKTNVAGFINTISIRRYHDQYLRSGHSKYSVSLENGLIEHYLPFVDCPEVIHFEKQREELMQEILNKWEDPCQSYFHLFLVLRQSHQEISLQKDFKSENHAKSQWHRCKQFLFRIFMERWEYLELGLEFLRDYEIRNLISTYKDELDEIWAYVNKKSNPSKQAYFSKKAKEDVSFARLVNYLKRQGGYRKIFAKPIILPWKEVFQLEHQRILPNIETQVFDQFHKNENTKIRASSQIFDDPNLQRQWLIWLGVEEALSQWAKYQFQQNYEAQHAETFMVFEKSKFNMFYEKFIRKEI